MRRREFIALLGGMAAAWPALALTQLDRKPQYIGVLLPVSPDDSEYPTLLNAFLQRLQQLGWGESRQLRIDVRWSGAAAEAVRKHAAELVALAPDVMVAAGAASTGPLLQTTRSIPVVLTVVPDPVGAGFVDSLAQPGGNATGFTSFEYGLGAKWLELFRELAPSRTRVRILRDPSITAGIGQWSAIQTVAPLLDLEVSPINLCDDALALERAILDFARFGSGGLIVSSSALPVRHRDLIVRVAAEQKLPALYYASAFVTWGGLFSYGPDRTELFRQAARYVDRILNGDKPSDLPVLAPAKYELVVNLKTAKALGLMIPDALLARADEVIE